MLEAGIQPRYVFDGKAPSMKRTVLRKRAASRDQAKKALEQETTTFESSDATEEAKAEHRDTIHKLQQRSTVVTPKHVSDIKTLLTLLGLPVIQAPGEAEAQCAALVQSQHAFATATEDMDALTFGSKKLLRNFLSPSSAKKPVLEIELDQIYAQLGLTRDQFVQFCILCECDYTGKIPGVGPVTALKLMQTHHQIPTILEYLKGAKKPLPADGEFLWEEASQLFVAPDVLDATGLSSQLVTKPMDLKALKIFLCDTHGFQESRVDSVCARLTKAINPAHNTRMNQGRLEQWFTTVPSAISASTPTPIPSAVPASTPMPVPSAVSASTPMSAPSAVSASIPTPAMTLPSPISPPLAPPSSSVSPDPLKIIIPRIGKIGSLVSKSTKSNTRALGSLKSPRKRPR